jgi:hypothetical protein
MTTSLSAPSSSSLGLPEPTLARVLVAGTWELRRLLGMIRVHVAAAGCAVLLLAAPWATHGFSRLNPWHVSAAFLRVYVLVWIVLAALVFASWIVRLASGRWTIYFSSTHDAVLALRTDEGTWTFTRHLVRRRRTGAGARLRAHVARGLLPGVQGGAKVLIPVPFGCLRSTLLRQFTGLRQGKTSLEMGPHFWGDQDQLGRVEFTQNLHLQIRRRIAERPHVSGLIALVGPWGSGKSFVLDRAAQALEFPETGESFVRVVRFNPWLFSDEDSLYAGFAQLLLQQLRHKRGRRRLMKLLEIAGPSSKFGSVDISGTLSNIASRINPARSSGSIEEALTSAMVASDPVCVLVDDVDRLTSEELLMLFKLVRLLGNVPNLHYVLAFDEDTVLTLLTDTTVGARDPVRARMYLEKMIEQRISVPPMTDDQVAERVIEPLLDYPAQAGFAVPKTALERLETVLTYSLIEHLTTVRLADRFVEAVKRLPATLQGELDYADWVFSVWIKMVAPPAWTYVLTHRDTLLAHGVKHLWREPSEAAVDLQDEIRALGFQGRLGEAVADILYALFPAAGASGRAVLGSTSIHESSQRQGIGVMPYFDRYVWADLPPGQLPDMRVIREARSIRLGPDIALRTETLRGLLNEDSAAVLRLLLHAVDDAEMQWPAILESLRLVLWDGTQSPDDAPARSQVRLIASRATYAMSQEQHVQLFVLAGQHPDQWHNILREIRRDELPPELRAQIASQLRELAASAFDAICSEFRDVVAPSVDQPDQMKRVWEMFRIDLPRFQDFLRIQVESGAWKLDEAATLLVQIYGTWPSWQHRGAPISSLVDAFGEESLLAFASTLDGPELSEGNFFFIDLPDNSSPATGDSILRTVRGAIRQWAMEKADKDGLASGRNFGEA